VDWLFGAGIWAAAELVKMLHTKGMNGSGCGTCLLWTVLLFGAGIWAAAELVKMLL
jgi:hypothetical protein